MDSWCLFFGCSSLPVLASSFGAAAMAMDRLGIFGPSTSASVSTHYESTEKFVDDESTEEAKTRRVNGKRSREAAVAQQRSGRKGSARIAHELFFLGDYRPLIQDTHGNVRISTTPMLDLCFMLKVIVKDAEITIGGQGQNASNRGRSSIFQGERVEPHYLSSSIFYGAQDASILINQLPVIGHLYQTQVTRKMVKMMILMEVPREEIGGKDPCITRSCIPILLDYRIR
ncbi:hypothetical protein IFM89_020583 [Coptis chinensis]|uniref:Uncharacterized protein n=1 Tax=Coptis chinensis TaxID=261450 RepID=A0A835MBX9_9MAGN|nr:hypothetical protein IFM89_020583 [Coptis chinensis]